MKKNSLSERWETMPIGRKLMFEMILVGLALFISNMTLYSRINRLVVQLNAVYASNANLTELSDSLSEVQSNMYRYLEIRDYDSLSNYFRAEDRFRNQYKKLSDEISDDPVRIMEKNIRSMSEEFLKITDKAVNAKRGNNVNLYISDYDRAMELYKYIRDSISTLNRERFISNRHSFEVLQKALSTMELTAVMILVFVLTITIILVYIMTKNIVSPIVERELTIQNNLKEAQLKFLQSQINPHFLFNCLNAGVQLAEMENDEKTSIFLERMADFFRYNVKKGNEESTVGEEVEMVNNYIYILNVRFAGEINFNSYVNERALGYSMPSMILQPIVENAINHGIRGRETECAVTLEVKDGLDDVVIIIKDTGVGMTIDQINNIFRNSRNTSESGSTGIGMDNVISRLRLYFETEDVISIESEGPNSGTSVILTIPKREKEDVQNTGG